MLIGLFQAVLQAHDVVAHEIYGEDASRITPVPSGHFENGFEEKESDPGFEGGEIPEVTRIRLIQFMKNTNEPLVSVRKTSIEFLATVAIRQSTI